MNILQINSVINRGSTGRIAESIGQLVLNEGWESYVYWGRGDNETKSTPLKYGSKLSIITHVLKTRLFDLHGFGSSVSTKKLIKEIDRIKPDIIHLHNIHGYYLNFKLLFQCLKTTNIPVVWTLHDCWSYTGHCAHYSAVECYKWKSECHNCPQLSSYPKSFFCDNSKRNFNLKKKLFSGCDKLHIVTVSEWLKQEVKQSFLKDKPIRVINNGVDLSLFKKNTNSKVKIPKQAVGKYILLSVATSWSKRKGLDDFIALSKELRNDEIIVLVGLPKKIIAKLPENIVGLERTESMEELVSLYSHAGIVLSLSVEETFGMTPVEGFACGTPAIVYNSTATPELITEETGKVVEPHDIKGIRKAIDEIRASDIDYQKTCRARAERLYNKDDRFADYIELYKEILKNK